MPDFFSILAARDALAVAGWRDGVAVRHGDLLARARAWAALGAGSAAASVALYHEDSLEFAAALLGAWFARKTVWLPADALPGTCAALAGRVGAFWGAFPASHAPAAPVAGQGEADVTSGPPSDFPALVVFTSGSTGAPAPIPKRLAQLTGEVATLESRFGALLGDADVVATVSHQHIYGLLFRVLWPLAAGRAIHAARHEFPETLAPALAARSSVLLASPAHLKRLPAHVDWRAAASSLRAVFSSGGMLEPEASRHARLLLGQAPREVYGSSETGGVAWRQRGDAGDAGDDGGDGGEAWTPLPGVQWRIDDGQLAVCSAQAGDGWLRTGDRAEAIDGARFLLRGRADRIVKIEEKRVSLDALEGALVASGLAREARVVPCPAPSGERQVLAAFVVPTGAGLAVLEGGKSALNARLRACLAGAVEAVALPRRWRYLDALPVNAQGKTTQALLLALLDGDAGESSLARPRFPRLRVLEQAAARVLLELTVPASLLYFDGHFPVAPVLPGVVQVDWVIHYGRRHFALDGEFAGMQALKFQQMIRPGQPVQLELLHDAARNTLNFRYFSEGGPHASGRIQFGGARAC